MLTVTWGGSMRAIWTVLACVAVMGCSESPDASGMPPRAVLGDDVADSVRAEVELVHELPEPTACDYVVAATFGWFCNGEPCEVPDPLYPSCSTDENIFALDIDVSAACPLTREELERVSAECSVHAISDDVVDCALRAQDSETFMC